MTQDEYKKVYKVLVKRVSSNCLRLKQLNGSLAAEFIYKGIDLKYNMHVCMMIKNNYIMSIPLLENPTLKLATTKDDCLFLT